jgi:hypothetical protein
MQAIKTKLPAAPAARNTKGLTSDRQCRQFIKKPQGY